MAMHLALIIHISDCWPIFTSRSSLFYPDLLKISFLGTVKFTVWAAGSYKLWYNELKGYLDHYLGLLTGSDGKVNENPIDKVSSLNDFLQVYNVRYNIKVQR